MTRSSVDLPPPDGPSRAVSDPPAIVTLTSSRATKVPNCFVTLWTEMVMVLPFPIGAKQVDRDEHEDCYGGEYERHRVCGWLVEVLEALLDEERRRLSLAEDAPGDHRDG